MHAFFHVFKEYSPLLLAQRDPFWSFLLNYSSFQGNFLGANSIWRIRLDLFHNLHFWSMPNIHLWPIVNKYIVIYQILAFYTFGEHLDICLSLKTNCSLLLVETLGAYRRDFEQPTQSLLKFWVHCLFSFFITSAVKVSNFSLQFFL